MGIHVHVTGEGVDWPAWVQAVGSVLAILIAAGLVKLERLHQDVASMDAFEGVGFAVKQIIDEVVTAAETHCLNGTELHQFPTRALEEMPEWLGQTPVFELSSQKAATMLLGWQRRLWSLKALISDAAAQQTVALDMPSIRKIQAETDADLAQIQSWLRYRRWRRRLWPLPFSTRVLKLMFPKTRP